MSKKELKATKVPMEYDVIIMEGHEALIGAVSEAICDGWKPKGGVSVTVINLVGPSVVHYAQAMVR